ncbi:MAG: DUF962 domain-containing protein [Labilithrix sp.]
MTDQEIATFEQFWDYYVGEHREKATRILHFVGTTAAMGCVAAGLLTKRRWLVLVALVAGYGPAWFSHFVIEKNRPATFKYPLWSLQADFIMWWKMVRGEMDAEVERVVEAERRADADKARERASESGEHVSMSSEAVN